MKGLGRNPRLLDGKQESFLCAIMPPPPPPSSKILELTEVLLVRIGGRGGQLEDVGHQEGQLE